MAQNNLDDVDRAQAWLDLVGDNLVAWNDALLKIRLEVQEWQKRVEREREKHPQVDSVTRKCIRSDSFQSSNGPKCASRGPVIHDTDESISEQPNHHGILRKARAEYVLFNADLQRSCEDLALRMQKAQNHLMRRMAIQHTCSTGQNPVQLRSSINAPANEGDGGTLLTYSSLTTLEKLLRTAQKECETAAHQLLRKGDCTVQLERIEHLFKQCGTLPVRTNPAESKCNTQRTQSGFPRPNLKAQLHNPSAEHKELLEPDDNSVASGSDDENRMVKFDEFHRRTKNIPPHIQG